MQTPMDVTLFVWKTMSSHSKMTVSVILSMYCILFYFVLSNNTHQCLTPVALSLVKSNRTLTSSTYLNITSRQNMDNATTLLVNLPLSRYTNEELKALNTERFPWKPLHGSNIKSKIIYNKDIFEKYHLYYNNMTTALSNDDDKVKTSGTLLKEPLHVNIRHGHKSYRVNKTQSFMNSINQRAVQHVTDNSTNSVSNIKPTWRMNSEHKSAHERINKTSLRESIGIKQRCRWNIVDCFVPLLILFTTWPDNTRADIRKNTCSNWAALRPLVHPVLFINNSAAGRECRRLGWSVLPLRHTAAAGAPVLKDLFYEVMQRFNSTFYGYSNGDILYGNNLLPTLMVVNESFDLQEKPLLVVGIRTNVLNVTSSEASSFRSLRKASRSRGRLFVNDSQDYFITNKVFPWSGIPGVVVGRVAYDNWLVLNSVSLNHTVIDATETILAVHQTTRKGIFEGHSRPVSNYNKQLLSLYYPRINYKAGSTLCARIVTKYSVTGGIFAMKREQISESCEHAYSGVIRSENNNMHFILFYLVEASISVLFLLQ